MRSAVGERERHTLETLLASRLSDRAILFGKIAASVSYGWGLTLVCLLAGLVTLNITSAAGKLILYPTWMGVGILIFTFFSSNLTATIGVLLSLRATSIGQVQQIMSLGWMALIFGIGYGVRLVARMLPKPGVKAVVEWLQSVLQVLGPGGLAVVSVFLLIACNGAFLGMAMRRFRRTRLILD